MQRLLNTHQQSLSLFTAVGGASTSLTYLESKQKHMLAYRKWHDIMLVEQIEHYSQQLHHIPCHSRYSRGKVDSYTSRGLTLAAVYEAMG